MQLLTGSVDAAFGNEAEASFVIALIVMFAIGVIFMLLSVTVYAMAMFTIARNEGYDKPWLAFIPVVNLLMIPILVEYDVHEQLRGHFVKVFVVACAVSLLLGGFLPFLVWVPTVLVYYGFYFIADRYSERPIIHMVLLVLTGGASLAFQLFRFRNRDSLYEEKQEYDLATS